MSMVQQIIQAVTMSQRQIDDQMSKLRAYNDQIEQVMQRVQSELSGSSQDFSQQMLNQLTQTKTQVQDTINKLQAAKDKLNQVKMI